MRSITMAGHGHSTSQSRVLLLVLGVVWGLNWPAVKVSLSGVSPWTLRSLGLGMAAITIFLLGYLRRRPLRVREGEWRHILVGGVLNIALFNLLVTFAQLGAATSRVAIITYSMPLWATALARVVLGERLNALRAFGLLIGICGLALLLWPLLASGMPHGVLLALGAAISWAMGTVYTKWAQLKTEPLAAAGWQMLVGAIITTACLLSFEGIPDLTSLHRDVIIAMSYHCTIGMAVGYITWFTLISTLPAGVAALGSLLVPVVGIVGAVIVLGERPGFNDLAGFALIFAAALCVLLPGGMAARQSATPG